MREARVAAGGVSRDPKVPPQSVRIVVQLFDCRAERLFGNGHASRWRHDDPLWRDQSICQVRSMSFEVCNRREELRDDRQRGADVDAQLACLGDQQQLRQAKAFDVLGNHHQCRCDGICAIDAMNANVRGMAEICQTGGPLTKRELKCGSPRHRPRQLQHLHELARGGIGNDEAFAEAVTERDSLRAIERRVYRDHVVTSSWQAPYHSDITAIRASAWRFSVAKTGSNAEIGRDRRTTGTGRVDYGFVCEISVPCEDPCSVLAYDRRIVTGIRMCKSCPHRSDIPDRFCHFAAIARLFRGLKDCTIFPVSTRLDRHVALKVIRPSELAGRDRLERFKREAESR